MLPHLLLQRRDTCLLQSLECHTALHLAQSGVRPRGPLTSSSSKGTAYVSV